MTPFSQVLHAFLILLSFIAIVLMGYNWWIVKYGKFRRIIFHYFIASLFFSARAIGGSLVDMGIPITQTIFFGVFWMLCGVLAFVFMIWGSWLLIAWLKETSFEGVK
jgi:hypothetical protein